MGNLKTRGASVAGIICAAAMCAAGSLGVLAGSAALGQVSTVLVAQPGEENKPISILVGQSQIVRPPWPVARVSVTDPTIADVEALTPEQVLVLGKKRRSTDLVMWSQDEKVWRARLDRGSDIERAKANLGRRSRGAGL